MVRGFEIVEELVGTSAIRGRMGVIPDSTGDDRQVRDIEVLRAEGCGAWYRQTACAASGTLCAKGGSGLCFLTWRARRKVPAHIATLPNARELPLGYQRAPSMFGQVFTNHYECWAGKP
jgi:hypothetical protein